MMILAFIVAPIIESVALAWGRRRWRRGFAAVGVGLVAVSIAVSQATGQIMFYDHGPRAASGFQTWVLPFAVATVVVLLIPVPKSRHWRALQLVGAILGHGLWVLTGCWIA